jgi:hypothetical protein
MNPAAIPLFKLQEETLIGKRFGIPVKEGCRQNLKSLGVGTSSIVEIRSVPIDGENEPAYLESLRDITEHRRIQRALQESQTALEAKESPWTRAATPFRYTAWKSLSNCQQHARPTTVCEYHFRNQLEK